MSSKSVAQVLYGKKKSDCQWCGREYIIKDSDAWEMTRYCCGECETLGDEAEAFEDGDESNA
jgi:hypothetical protein